jgi:EAL domain-containing protein (putative c-di-GMP-specific phosphodiesterase class I)
VSDRITGFEALLRWNHPERGVLTPADFISIAEDSGLILPIGNWVLREACCQCVEWQKQYNTDPPLSINVNLSSRQFMAPDLADEISRILTDTGLEPQYLGLEIIEDIFISIGKGAIPILTRLKSLGIRLQIDDFGKGYSTFTYLPQFPISTIKIGRSFINRILSNGSLDVVQAMVHFAQDLGMTAVAEGIETKEQLAQLKDMNCPMGQGFYLGRPLDTAKINELMNKRDAA